MEANENFSSISTALQHIKKEQRKFAANKVDRCRFNVVDPYVVTRSRHQKLDYFFFFFQPLVIFVSQENWSFISLQPCKVSSIGRAGLEEPQKKNHHFRNLSQCLQNAVTENNTFWMVVHIACYPSIVIRCYPI